MIARCLLALAAATAGAAAHAATLTPYVAHYEVMRNGKPLGTGTVTLEPDGRGHWQLTSVTEGTRGLASLAGVEIRERSVVDVRDDAIETLDYTYTQSAGWKTRKRSVRFDHANKRIVSRDRDREFGFDLQAGVLDRQAVSLALSRDVARGKTGRLSYTVVDRDELGPQDFVVGPRESVPTPGGNLAAVRVDRERKDGRGRTTTSWLGIEQGFVPVRVLQTEADGDSFDMRLVSIER
ncbi:DUF3108 domain-containing protein [Chiayiivirga flava]|uniref:DUF3108 domain-containing protein n=1 Tax=Chiayiivirga flava TaxID=659595 RepID=A0A7W8D7Q7_9GAMM|nr:DUF3108 domain-containing protein [Chiayiivirga flava]MBB5209449.1 hypothetical protein [Chiayiivirga flava]